MEENVNVSEINIKDFGVYLSFGAVEVVHKVDQRLPPAGAKDASRGPEDLPLGLDTERVAVSIGDLPALWNSWVALHLLVLPKSLAKLTSSSMDVNQI